jgi:hypothetical protein
MAMWMRGGLKDFIARNLSTACLNDVGVLNPASVTALMEAHHGRVSLNDRQVFAVLMFQRWSTRRMQSALATTA